MDLDIKDTSAANDECSARGGYRFALVLFKAFRGKERARVCSGKPRVTERAKPPAAKTDVSRHAGSRLGIPPPYRKRKLRSDFSGEARKSTCCQRVWRLHETPFVKIVDSAVRFLHALFFYPSTLPPSQLLIAFPLLSPA